MAERDAQGRYMRRIPPADPLPDKAFLFIELDRASGKITIDEEFSTPLETYAMLLRASQDREDRWQGTTE